MSDQTHYYDVLVVGTGNAACSAALSAVEKTPRVGMLEKAPQRDRGGNSMLTVLMRFAFNGMEDIRPLVRNFSEEEMRPLLDLLPHRTEAELWDEIMRVTHNQSDQELLEVHVMESLRTVHWLASKGHDWTPATIRDDNVVTMNGGGAGLQARNFAMLEKAGVRFHYETSATELMQDEQGRVIGVHALTPQGYVAFRAKSVILACGSYESNPEMRARYLGPGWDMVHLRGVPFNTGDGLRMALDIGAMPHGSWSTCHASPQDINLPVFTVPSAHSLRDSQTRYMYPWGIMVNTNAERFIDEAYDTRGRTYAAMGRSVLAQPGGIAFQIHDAKIRKMNLYTPNYDSATTAKANTIEELANELEIDPKKLVRTVTEFNAAVQPGNYNPNRYQLDGKCTARITPPKSNYALEIDEPPFEAWPVRCGLTFTFGGLKVDPKSAQVQHVAGRPIPGLYAAGEMLGGLWVHSYASGSGMMAGATFGRIAGAHAALVASG